MNDAPARVVAAPSSIESALDRVIARLTAAGVPSPRADAELLAGHVLGLSRGAVLAKALSGQRMQPADEVALTGLAERRAAREPLQHLLGRAPFRSIELAVGPGVFVPRPETEVLVDAVLVAAPQAGHVVDLGTGSGAIALSIASERPDLTVIGVENQPLAFVWARENAAALALPNVRIVFDDLATALPDAAGTVDVVVSNPPYIPDGMIPRDPEVRLHDPQTALFGGEDGLDPMRAVVATALRLLRPGGTLAVEHAEQQGAAVRALVDPARWRDAATHPDLTGRDRITVAVRL